MKYTAKQTNKKWNLFTGPYYDCHIVSVPQIISRDIFYLWVVYISSFKIFAGWDSFYVRAPIDSEHERDKSLFGAFGVQKSYVDINFTNCEDRINETIKSNGFVIARVDSFYHQHFVDDYGKKHVTGHKVVIVDWDDNNYYLIDNTGIGSSIISVGKQKLFLSILANLYHAYEKHDTLYILENSRNQPSKDATSKLMITFIHDYKKYRKDLADKIVSLIHRTEKDLVVFREEKRTAFLRNMHHTLWALEYSYQIHRHYIEHVFNYTGCRFDVDRFKKSILKVERTSAFLKILLNKNQSKFSDYDEIVSGFDMLWKHEIELSKVWEAIDV